ncbi:hypothetical protein RUM43_012913 [Polyplax serrata]|uniref:G-protein coupled receptors family 1 profile domain-containing protein n=1 Tax=Polyplax serrata TaxID=468196 RepID=A0AAN8PTU2_POLSC
MTVDRKQLDGINLTSEYNSTWNCSNDYCLSDDDYMSLIESYITTLNEYEWALVVMHALVFFVGLIGNALVCLAVYRNHSMRTVTNYFIVNLALADFLVILFCLAPTVIWDVTETWFMGEKLCKIILYIQVNEEIGLLSIKFPIFLNMWTYSGAFKGSVSGSA